MTEIMFSNHITVSSRHDGGVVLEFNQKLPDNSLATVSCIGINIAHTQKLIELLTEHIKGADNPDHTNNPAQINYWIAKGWF